MASTIKSIAIGRREERVTVRVGDVIGFKCDKEQEAEIIGFNSRGWTGHPMIIVKAPRGGFSGDYIGRSDTHDVEPERAWPAPDTTQWVRNGGEL